MKYCILIIFCFCTSICYSYDISIRKPLGHDLSLEKELEFEKFKVSDFNKECGTNLKTRGGDHEMNVIVKEDLCGLIKELEKVLGKGSVRVFSIYRSINVYKIYKFIKKYSTF